MVDCPNPCTPVVVGGGGGGGELLTVTVTTPAVAELPAASLATALRVWEPFAPAVVFHEIEYGEVVTSAPRLAPSRGNCTDATPTLSVACAETVTEPLTVLPLLGAVMEITGGVVSGGLAAPSVSV